MAKLNVGDLVRTKAGKDFALYRVCDGPAHDEELRFMKGTDIGTVVDVNDTLGGEPMFRIMTTSGIVGWAETWCIDALEEG